MHFTVMHADHLLRNEMYLLNALNLTFRYTAEISHGDRYARI